MTYLRQGFGILVTFLAGLYIIKAEWVVFNDKEYYFGTMATEIKNTWHTSRSFCQQSGGDLVSITSHEEYTWIVDQQKSSAYKGNIWIGLNYLDSEAWRWSDGEIFSIDYWYMNYPLSPEDTGEKYFCGVQAANYHSYLWLNQHCGGHAGFLCKRNPGSTDPITDPPTPSVGGFCPSGYFTSDEENNKCFKVVQVDDLDSHGLNYSAAVAECRKGPGFNPDIASIHSPVENALIQTQFKTNSLSMWIGFHTIDWYANEDTWYWTDNSAITFKNWAVSKPSFMDGQCCEILNENNIDTPGTWNNIGCQFKRGYICQTFKSSNDIIATSPPTTPNACQSGYASYDHGCYKIVQDSPKTWDEASQYCKNEGADLVSIHSSPENSALFVKLSSFNEDAWIGFRDYNGNGEYTWSDHWGVQYTNWGINEPADSSTGSCVSMNKDDGNWYTEKCDTNKIFICKITSAEPVTLPTHLDGYCPGEEKGDTSWIHFGEYCYLFVRMFNVGWRDANEACTKASHLSQLASIHSSSENNFILKQMNEESSSPWNAWIGMYRSNLDKKWEWIDGSAVQYTNWAPGEPDGHDIGEDCTMMYKSDYAGQWNDEPCNTNNGYVCKSQKVPKVTPAPVDSGTCPEDWIRFGTYCYMFQPNRRLEHKKAQQECVLRGGQGASLASIHNYVESEFIHEEMQKLDELPDPLDYWIGLVKDGPRNEGNEFYWLDGSASNYTLWDVWAPTSSKGSDCVFAYSSKKTWYNTQCEYARAYVCKVAIEFSHGLSVGAIVGIVFGVLASIALLVFLIIFILDRYEVINIRLFRESNVLI